MFRSNSRILPDQRIVLISNHAAQAFKLAAAKGHESTAGRR